MKRILKGRSSYDITLVIVAVSFFVVLFIDAGITTLSADDYWYSTFLNHGIVNWINMMRYHYEIFNGRVFVHLWATGILHFGNIAFAVILVASLAVIGYCVQSDSAYWNLLFPALFLGGVILMPRAMKNEGFFWISAFCNYVIPTAMTVWLFRCSRQILSHGSFRWPAAVGLPILSFLCGATTEQSGAGVCILLALIFAETLITRNHACGKISFVQILFALIGLFSIFHSPATLLRLQNESNRPIIEGAIIALSKQRELLLDCPEMIALFAVFPILLYIYYFQQKEKSLFAVFGVLTEVCLFAMLLIGGNSGAYCYGGVLLLYIALAAICWVIGDREIGSLLCYACFTTAIILFTDSSGYRIFVPMYILLLAISCDLFCNIVDGLPTACGKLIKIPITCFFVFVFACAMHDFPKYQHNFQIENQNNEYASQARTSGILYYCIDYDEEYTHTKAYNDGYFFSKYVESVELPSSRNAVYLYSKHLPIVLVNGDRITSPAMKDSFDQWLLPLRDVVENSGGTVNWSKDAGTTIQWNGATYTLSETAKNYRLSWYDDGDKYAEFPSELKYKYYAAMLPISFFTDILGFDVEISGSEIYVNSGEL